MAASTVENDAYASMVGRMIRAYGRRVAKGDEVDLARMLELRRDFDAAIHAAVQSMRAEGIPWSYIAEGAGISRQAAWERWHHPIAASETSVG